MSLVARHLSILRTVSVPRSSDWTAAHRVQPQFVL